jgi:hypothetical protein
VFVRLNRLLSQKKLQLGMISSTVSEHFRASLFIIITGIRSKRMEQTLTKEQPQGKLAAAFLSDLAHANRSQHTCHAYATGLAQLCAFYQRPLQALTAEVLRNFFSLHLHLSPATRANKLQ